MTCIHSCSPLRSIQVQPLSSSSFFPHSTHRRTTYSSEVMVTEWTEGYILHVAFSRHTDPGQLRVVFVQEILLTGEHVTALEAAEVVATLDEGFFLVVPVTVTLLAFESVSKEILEPVD
jgi:hypothetical protein